MLVFQNLKFLQGIKISYGNKILKTSVCFRVYLALIRLC
ncbi:hypothetical protein N409_05820 [Helicobacter pylori FD719]|nr:hypothetical protein N409_08650 [Helicobacter pylori FD719]EQL73119.1 hypothetical protein N409_05820 [Helicobacter pylori FD719]